MAAIYVAKDYNDATLSIVLAVDERHAQAFWHGAGVHPHHTVTVTPSMLKNHPTGVIPLIILEDPNEQI